ncbi:MAG: hypothetical protein GY943_30045, partial [Chloroflexi bacterium]|nr:hypothetical protein [Chloroflexota bacterium]
MNELESFVLGYLEQVDSIVEPAVYDTHEVLLPEAVAERWQTAVYQHIAFTDVEDTDVTRLGYNHPLVEQMVEEASSKSASTQFFINRLQLNKTDIDKLAAKEWVIVNGRVLSPKRATIARVRSTYIRFNFKAAIISDEKKELLVSLLMDAHSGHPVMQTELIEAKANDIEPDIILRSLSDAPIRWKPDDGRPLKSPLDERTLTALLERGKTAVLDELADTLKELQKRVSRFRELDKARLTTYYDELEHDLQHRLKTASKDRKSSLQDKLSAIQTERTLKLTDVDERYRVKLELTLLNLLIIQQPKLVMPILIENRTTKANDYAVWDPLLHRLERPICGVCGLPAERAYFCHNGHLAHEACLAPACIDCKRVYCQQCTDEVGSCDVCHDPLCHRSRILCPDCGRFTCQTHQNLCHANDGKPVDLSIKSVQPPQKSEPEPPAPKPKPNPKLRSPKRSQPIRQPKKSTSPRMPKGVPKPQRLEVMVYPDAIIAFVLASRER